jgi:hypothetical protein
VVATLLGEELHVRCLVPKRAGLAAAVLSGGAGVAAKLEVLGVQIVGEDFDSPACGGSSGSARLHAVVQQHPGSSSSSSNSSPPPLLLPAQNYCSTVATTHPGHNLRFCVRTCVCGSLPVHPLHTTFTVR